MSHEEIQHHIYSLSKEKAPCPDFLTNERIIFCGDKIVDELGILFYSILRHAHVPQMFKVGTCKVLSEFKGKDKSNPPTNNRGNTITSALSKLFERVILFYIENDFSHIHYNLVLELIMLSSLLVMIEKKLLVIIIVEVHQFSVLFLITKRLLI